MFHIVIVFFVLIGLFHIPQNIINKQGLKTQVKINKNTNYYLLYLNKLKR